MLGEVVGNYRITGALSAGGMGAVYRAEHTLIGKPAAVKVLLPEWSSNHEIVARFFTEAKATTAIRHPGIVEIFDFGHTPDGRAYLVMELLDGEPLASRLAQVGRIAEPVAVGLMRSMVGALAAAHAAGIVHRDLKPDNVFLVRDPDVPGGERPKLLDFGIAKLADLQPSARATRTGVVLGTPTYMAPEQCRGASNVDARADLYALGCILFEMLAGRPPFAGESAGELMAHHLMTPAEHVRAYAPEVSPAIDLVIAKLLMKPPGDRHASAADLLAALGGVPDDASGRPMALVTPAWLTPVPSLRGPTGALAAATVPTTLSGAATPRPPTIAASSRRGVWIGGGVVAIALGAGAAWFAGRGASAPATNASAPATNAAAPIPSTPAPVTTPSPPLPVPVPVPVPVPETAAATGSGSGAVAGSGSGSGSGAVAGSGSVAGSAPATGSAPAPATASAKPASPPHSSHRPHPRPSPRPSPSTPPPLQPALPPEL
ncbi:MAG: serine/threonine protein kinase [Deltaproteobacteria bacterium]|nr:serine/threonine protein kinase [Deltaproteobacteria bacterium]